RSLQGLSADRADIIVAGIAVVDSLMRRFDTNRLQIHDRGVRDGLLLTMMEKATGVTADVATQREAAVERFATSCGVDMNHSRQVARLAGRIFDQLVEPLELDPA